jgi:hypothetical protein
MFNKKMSGWQYDGTLLRMCDILKQPYVNFPYKVYPHVAYCNKEELTELWTAAYEKLDRIYLALEDPLLSLRFEKMYYDDIERIEKQIDEIDYQWSRFPKTDAEMVLPPLEPRVYGPCLRSTVKR